MQSGPSNNNDINTTLKKLLNEVLNGNYENFRIYLREKNITKLDFSIEKYGRHNLKNLGFALQNTFVTGIDLSLNGIDDQGVSDFGNTLCYTFITCVRLCNNNIGNEGAKKFFHALQKNTLVDSVDLSGNNIGDQGFLAITTLLPETQIRSFTFSWINFFDPADVMRNHTKLSLTERLCLHKIKRNFKKAFHLHQMRLNINIVLHFKHYTPKKQLACWDQPRLTENSTQTDEILYAGGILKHLPNEIVLHIAKFLRKMPKQDKFYALVIEYEQRMKQRTYLPSLQSSRNEKGKEEEKQDDVNLREELKKHNMRI